MLDQDSLALPARAQALLKSRGWFQSVSGVLFSHSDTRVSRAPLWVRLLAPTRTLVYTAQLAWLFKKFGAFLLPLIMLAVVGMDPVMKDALNRDGENAGGSSSHYTFVLSAAALSSEWLNGILFDYGDLGAGRNNHLQPLDHSAQGAAAANPGSTVNPYGWLTYIFPVAESWTAFFCWPVGAAIGLFLIQYFFPLCSSAQWVAIWNGTGLAVVVVYTSVVPGAYMVLTLCFVVSAIQHFGCICLRANPA